MRTIVRVGGLVGGLAFILLYAAQTNIALAVTPGVTLAGVCAGLAIAKWLEREWYGRQLIAGLRAGAIASTIAGIGAALSLLFLGPHDLADLAARSHLALFDASPIVSAFGFLDWTGVDVLAIVLAAAAGTVLAAFTCQLFAWSKSAHAIKVIAQARLAAQSLNRDELYRATGAPTTSTTYGPAMHSSGLLAQLGAPTSGAGVSTITGTTPALGVIPPPTFSPSSVPVPASQRRATAGPAPASTPAAGIPVQPPAAASATPVAEYAPTEPAIPAASPAANTPPRRSPSAARRAEAELTDAMREALAAWANDSTNGTNNTNNANNTADPKKPGMGEKAKPSRAPAPSAYLNSSPPVKRGRKKTDTQDWLC